MAELTIQISDALAQRLQPIHQQLPDLLQQWVDSSGIQPDPAQSVPSVYSEVIDFFLSQPTPEQVRLFKISPQAQAHLRSLLDKNRTQGLSEDEQAELDIYEQLDSFMSLLKARAHGLLSA